MALCDHAHRSTGHVIRSSDRDGGAPHPDRLAARAGLTPAQQGILDGDYADYLAAIPDSAAKTDGIAIGEQVAAAMVALRTNDGREKNPTLCRPKPAAARPWHLGKPGIRASRPGASPAGNHAARA